MSSCFVFAPIPDPLSHERLAEILELMIACLKGRVREAYLFGSASLGTMHSESDIDLILIVENPKKPFIERGFEFRDLFEIFSRLDILVYTRKEFEGQLADSGTGFWKAVRLSLRRIL